MGNNPTASDKLGNYDYDGRSIVSTYQRQCPVVSKIMKKDDPAYRIVLLFTLLTVLLFLPPAVTMFRNPPPHDLIQTWWLRFSVALVTMYLNLIVIFERPRSFRWAPVLHSLLFAIAAVVAAMLLQWPQEYPHLFGLPDATGYR